MFIPDFQIEALCGDGYPRTWSPSGGPHVGQEFPIENAGPLISPFAAEFLGAASYDIQIGNKFASPLEMEAYVMRSGQVVRKLPPSKEIDGLLLKLHADERIDIILQPKQPVLCHSTEYVRIPPHLVGLLTVRSSFARDWIDHSSATSVWPGFQGNITFELTNSSPSTYRLRSGARALQLAFAKMAAVPAKPYNGVYQKQEGQLHSRMVHEK
jgi:deoxycytidine triphosphate deaminase